MVIPKKEIVARKKAERLAAGLEHFNCWIDPKFREDMQMYYNELCERFKVPQEFRTEFRK